MIVKFLVPAWAIAAMRCSGIPQSPKPPAMIVMPSDSVPSKADEALT
jgi:hypothetical protein